MIQSHKPPADLIGFLGPYDRKIQRLALGLRKIVIEELGPCYENIYDAYSAVAMGYGSSERMSDGVCHIAVYERGVNLGFFHGTSLPDPEGVLEGAGKRIRHLSLKTKDDLDRPEIRVFLKRALSLAREDARKLGEAFEMGTKPGIVTSKVKSIYKKKRRPS
ncbi:MAG TPA: DUF1801 domain-containing protein [Pyrinomonadaceae bacterium]|nr:DUF1801 domain-containing protein [Pyrinomonadaceae bacterium]